MKKLKIIITSTLTLLCLISCGIYSFNGISISPEVKTFEVKPFSNEAQIVIPGLDRRFTTALQDLILDQTNLSLTNKGGDIVYEGEITSYYIAPNAATADQNAAENRLTISVRLRYIDTKDEKNDLEKSFSFFFDYDGQALLSGDTEENAYSTIFERITQDMVNATLARW